MLNLALASLCAVPKVITAGATSAARHPRSHTQYPTLVCASSPLTTSGTDCALKVELRDLSSLKLFLSPDTLILPRLYPFPCVSCFLVYVPCRCSLPQVLHWHLVVLCRVFFACGSVTSPFPSPASKLGTQHPLHPPAFWNYHVFEKDAPHILTITATDGQPAMRKFRSICHQNGWAASPSRPTANQA